MHELTELIVRRSTMKGMVKVSGAKNSALRLLAASLLTDKPIQLTNYPATLLDAQIHVEMLEALGKSCAIAGDRIVITESAPPPSRFTWHKRSIRNTLLILGALTARIGAAAVPLPGGCKLGERKYDLHVMLLEDLGARVWEDGDMLCTEAPNGLVGTDIRLPLRSTGATENAILCGTLARGRTTIWNPHIRPEILDLVALLRSMGAEIRVYGQERIEVEGNRSLGAAQHRVLPDNMEALTWLIAATITGGDVEIRDFPFADLEVPLAFLRESGANYFRSENSVLVRGGHCYPVEISTGPYPGINSDMQPLFAVFGALSDGVSKIIDLRFPGRYAYAEELAKLGMEYHEQGNLLTIQGGRAFRGARVRALDLRAGIALMLAGLVADGETVITDAWQIGRGYDRLMEKLGALGGDVEVAKLAEPA